MDVVEASNKQWRVNPEPMRAAIARAAAMDREAAGRALDGFWFPTAKAQKSDAWLGGEVQTQSKKMADFFAANGRLIKALDSYTAFISTRFLR